MSFDPFQGRQVNPYPIYDNLQLITPSDTNDLDTIASSIWVDSPGAIRVTTAGGQDIAFADALSASPFGASSGGLALRIRKIWATGTTVTKVFALW